MKTKEEFTEMVLEKYNEQHGYRIEPKGLGVFETWLINEMRGMYTELEGYRQISAAIPTEP